MATLRSEFLTGLLTTGFAHLFRIPVVIGSLSRAALFEVIEAPGGGIDTIHSSISYVLPANVERLILTGTAPNTARNGSG